MKSYSKDSALFYFKLITASDSPPSTTPAPRYEDFVFSCFSVSRTQATCSIFFALSAFPENSLSIDVLWSSELEMLIPGKYQSQLDVVSPVSQPSFVSSFFF